MHIDRFEQLSRDQQWTMIIAHEVRNAAEKFHADQGGYGLIPDSLMPELNQRVRRRVHQIVFALMNCDEQHPGCVEAVGRAVTCISPDWEVPEMLPEELTYYAKGMGFPQLRDKAVMAREQRNSKEEKRWKSHVLSPNEKKLVAWFKKAFADQREEVKAEQVTAKMTEMGFFNRSGEVWEHLSWFGNIYRRADLASWSRRQRKKWGG